MNISKQDIEKIANMNHEADFEEMYNMISTACEKFGIKKVGRKSYVESYPTFLIVALLLMMKDTPANPINVDLIVNSVFHGKDSRMDYYMRSLFIRLIQLYQEVIQAVQEGVAQDEQSKYKLLSALMHPCSKRLKEFAMRPFILSELKAEADDTVAILKPGSRVKSYTAYSFEDMFFDVMASDLLLMYPDIKCCIIQLDDDVADELLNSLTSTTSLHSHMISPEIIAAIRCSILGVDYKFVDSQVFKDGMEDLGADRIINLNNMLYNNYPEGIGNVKRIIQNISRSLPQGRISIVDMGILSAIINNPGMLGGSRFYGLMCVLSHEKNDEVTFFTTADSETILKVSNKDIKENMYSLDIKTYSGNIFNGNSVSFYDRFGDSVASAVCRSMLSTTSRQHDMYSDEATPYVIVSLSNAEREKKYIKEQFIPEKKREILLKNGDIVVSRIGNPVFYVVDWLNENEGMALTVNQIGFKIGDKRFLPEYICQYLNSEWGQGQLLGSRTGSIGMMSLTIDLLAAIQIPLLDIAIQEEIINAYRLLREKQKKLEREYDVYKSIFGALHEYIGEHGGDDSSIRRCSGWYAEALESMSEGETRSNTDIRRYFVNK